MFIFSVFILKEKAKTAGIIISCIITIGMTALSLAKPVIYNPVLLFSDNDYGIEFDDTFSARLSDDKFGTVSIEYNKNLETYELDARFKRAGKTDLIIESPDGDEYIFETNIKSYGHEITKK